MTDNIRTNFCATCKEQADRIEALTAENERLSLKIYSAILDERAAIIKWLMRPEYNDEGRKGEYFAFCIGGEEHLEAEQ